MLRVGSKTPPKIAVSVMAEVLVVKNGVALPHDMEGAQAENELAVAGNDAWNWCAGWSVRHIEAKSGGR